MIEYYRYWFGDSFCLHTPTYIDTCRYSMTSPASPKMMRSIDYTKPWTLQGIYPAVQIFNGSWFCLDKLLQSKAITRWPKNILRTSLRSIYWKNLDPARNHETIVLRFQKWTDGTHEENVKLDKFHTLKLPLKYRMDHFYGAEGLGTFVIPRSSGLPPRGEAK